MWRGGSNNFYDTRAEVIRAWDPGSQAYDARACHLLPQDILEAESVDAQGVPQRDFGAVSMTLM